ncbi:MAG TPA: hypothetical protein VNS58_08425 [Puia sp.]|nr:hypothetical protein [Puia sp.]
MRTESQILDKLRELEEELQKIQTLKTEEMSKDVTLRDNRMLKFLYREFSVFQSAVSELKAVLQ